MTKPSEQLKIAIGNWAGELKKRPHLIAITIPGGVGGAVFYFLGVMRLPGTSVSLAGLLLSVVLGLFAGIVLIGLITNTDRKDVIRLVALAFLGGLGWPLVIDQGLNLLFGQNGNSAASYADAGQFLGTAALIQKSGSGRVDARLERVAADFAESLPEEGPLRDDVLGTILDRLASLEEYQRGAAIDALEQQVQLDSEETLRLDDLRDVTTPTDDLSPFRGRIEAIVPNHLMNPPDNSAVIAETMELTTDEYGGVRFRVTGASRYEIQTRDSEIDLVAALYSSAGGPPIVVDDDSGQDLNPRIETTLGADEDYILKLFDYGTGDEVGVGIPVSFRRLPE